MPNLATVLKEEITRLARKEVKAGTGAIRNANSQYRRSIAHLKRQVDALAQKVAYLESQERKRSTTAIPETLAEGRRFSRRGLKAHRNKLGLSAADYADLVGVSAQTVYSWERGKSKPRDLRLATLVAIRDVGKRDAWKRLEVLHG